MADDEVVILSDSEDEGQATGQVKNGKAVDLKLKVEPENAVKVNGDSDEKKSKNGHKEIDLSDDAAKKINGASATVNLDDDDDLQFIEELIAGPSGSQHGSMASDEKSSEGDLMEVEEESPDRLAVKNALENLFLNLRGIRGKIDMTPVQRKKVRASYLAMLDEVDMTQDNVKDRLLELIAAAEAKMEEKKKVPWKVLGELKEFMIRKKIGKKVKNSEKKSETEDERKERKNRQRIVVLEERLGKLEKLIEDWEKKEVDLDDEANSSYLVKARLQKSYMKAYNEICRATGSNYHTGRPIEKSIRLKDEITRFPEVKAAVEKFVNSKNCLFVPDFYDIKKVVETVNKNSRPELFTKEEGEEIAQDLFKAVLSKIKKRQEADVKVALPEWHKVEISPEVDPELEKKLQENSKQWKNEHEVIEKFVQRQLELQAEATDVLEEDADESAPESDDDLDTEDEQADDAEDSDHFDPAAESREEYRRDLVDPDDDINSDDEEQVAPVISQETDPTDPPPKRQKVDDSL